MVQSTVAAALRRDLGNIVHDLRGVGLNVTAQPSEAGKRLLDMIGVFAEFEMNLRRKAPGGKNCQSEGERRLRAGDMKAQDIGGARVQRNLEQMAQNL